MVAFHPPNMTESRNNRTSLFRAGAIRAYHSRHPGCVVPDRVTLQLLQRSTLFIVQRQVQMITLLVSAQPSLAGRPYPLRPYAVYIDYP